MSAGTILALAFLALALAFAARVHGVRLVWRWNRCHPAIRVRYTLATRRAWHLRCGRLFVGVVIDPWH